MATFDIDAFIARLCSKPGSPGQKVKCVKADIVSVCRLVQNVFLHQPMLLEINGPLVICGDIHGQFYDLLRIFEYCGHPPDTNFLFLGDYVDRGDQSIETISLLFAYKVKYPEQFFLLRGNHESESTNHVYGFYNECKKRYDTKLWKTFNDTFNFLPVSAIVGEKIFCCHGGLSPTLNNFDQIRNLKRPTDVPDEGIMCDLLWSDPDPGTLLWAANKERAVSHLFGAEAVHQFLEAHDLDLVCRAHQVVENGYEFFAQRKVITLFSAPNYCGDMNTGGMMFVDAEMKCTMHLLEPKKGNGGT